MASMNTNQSVDFGDRTTTLKDTASIDNSPNKVERK